MVFKSCFKFIWSSHSYLMVARSEIQLCEPLSPSKFIQQFIHSWQGVFVFDSNGIQMSLIHTKPPCAIFFLHQKDRRGKWT
jgi:hypothetical protein